MKLMLNHNRQSFPASLSLTENETMEIVKICKDSLHNISFSLIIEYIHELFGINGALLASNILGQMIAAQKTQSETNKNLLTCQNLN